MQVLNLYAGLGGNRRLWADVEVTAVENNPQIADAYSSIFPADTIVIDDAHSYLEQHYKQFDFIWSSPPCQTHSKVRMMASKHGSYDAVMPSMNLWAEIIFLQYFAVSKWVVENVVPYYPPLVEPSQKIERHLFWANFAIPPIGIKDRLTHNERGMSHKGFFDLSDSKMEHRRDQIIRNSVNPRIGLYVFNCAKIRTALFDIEPKIPQMGYKVSTC